MKRPVEKIKGVSGIYQIRNTVNEKFYVGRTNCFYKRYAQYLHDFKFRNIGHLNDHLFNSMKKYGINKFSFEIVEKCTVENSPEREFYWIIVKKSLDRNFGYNLRMDVGGSMVTHPETSKKISNRLKREWAEGKRSNHSQRLKESWNQRDRVAQGKLFSQIKTKFIYAIDGIEVNYSVLKTLGLTSALSSFHRTKSDHIVLRGVNIQRRRL